MSRRTATAIAATALVLVVALDSATIVLGLGRGESVRHTAPFHVIDALNQASFALLAVLGLAIAWYRPRNLVWVLGTLTGVCSALSGVAFEYVLLITARGQHNLPGLGLATSLAIWSWGPQVFTAPLVMLIYPTGRLVSRNWRWVAAVIVAAGVLTTLILALEPGQVYGPTSSFVNPIGVPALLGVANAVNNFVFIATTVFALVGVGSLVVRFRRAAGDERQQIKWLGFAAAIFALQVLISNVIYAAGLDNLDGLATAINIVSVVAFPVAVAIGILRYRLFDIDLVINRTLVYGTLAALITGFYVAVVVGLGSVVGSRSNLLLAIVATAIIAVGFQPLRARLQRLANRLVFGSRATPYEVLAQFSRQVADAYSGEDVLTRMARVVGEATGAESAAVWLGDRPAASWRAVANGQAAPGAEKRVEVSDHGERLGALTLRMRRGQSLTQHEEKLLADLAGQAGLVLRNVGLNQQLLQRLEELRASRERLVRAQTEERRRLERDLHDGAQQHLVALKLRVGLLKEAIAAQPEQLPQLAREVEAEADGALRTMRELARGIYPPLLADGGLRAALEAQTRRATVPVELAAAGIGRYPADVEAAVYFCVLEALQNVQKHAAARSVRVQLAQRDDRLEFEVGDDGAGFDPEQSAAGAGLANMRDRLEALGGDLRVVSARGQGTHVFGAVPVQPSSASSSAILSNPSRTPDSIPDATIASRSASD